MKRALGSPLLFAIFSIPTGRPTVEIVNFHMVESLREKRSLEMTAQNAQVFKTEELTVLKNLNSQIFDKEGQVYTANGQLGVYNMTQRDLEVSGNSSVLSPEFYKFESDRFIFLDKDKKFVSSHPVKAFQDLPSGKSPVHMTGEGFELDLKKQKYEIKSKVKAEQKLANGQTFQIQSDSALLEPQKGGATFIQRVKVKGKDLVIDGDRLEIVFSQNNVPGGPQSPESLKMQALQTQNKNRKVDAKIGNIQVDSDGIELKFLPNGDLGPTEAFGAVTARTQDGVKMTSERMKVINENGANLIELYGNVKILTQNRVATCENALYRPDTGDVILKKVASIKSTNQNIEGEQIKFSTKNSEILVEKARGQVTKEDLGLR